MNTGNPTTEQIKQYGKKLKSILNKMNIPLAHTSSLNVISEVFGFKNFNTAKAALQKKNNSKLTAGVLDYRDSKGNPIELDFFDSEENNNFSLFGASGHGTSYFFQDRVLKNIENGAKSIIVSHSSTYETFTNSVGGEHLTAEEQCFNFFTNAKTDDSGSLLEVEDFVEIIKLMGAKTKEDSILKNAIVEAFDINGHEAGMEDILNALEKHQGNYDLVSSLLSFGNPKGKYYRYFNGRCSLDFKSDFISIGMYGNIENIDDFFEPAYRALLVEVARFFESGIEQGKTLFIDDYWILRDKYIIIGALGAIAEQSKKWNASLGVHYQSFEEVSGLEAKDLLMQSTWKLTYKYPLSESRESIHGNYFDFEMQRNDRHKYLRDSRLPNGYRDIMITKRGEASIDTKIVRLRHKEAQKR